MRTNRFIAGIFFAGISAGCGGHDRIESTPIPAPTVAKSSVPAAAFVGYTEVVRSTFYFAGEKHSDPDTDAGRSSTGVKLRPATATQIGVCAVDPTVIPYGSRVIVQTDDGPRYYIAADTGGAVKAEVASAGALHVIDFYSDKQVGLEDQLVTIIPYAGSTRFKDLTAGQQRRLFDMPEFTTAATRFR